MCQNHHPQSQSPPRCTHVRRYAGVLHASGGAHTYVHTHAHTHTYSIEAVDCICPSSSGSVVAAPAASPPPVTFDSHGRIHHLLGSLGASQLPPGGFAADGSREALGLKPSPSFFFRRQLCGRQTEVRRRCESLEPTEGTAGFRRRPCLLFHLFLGGRSRPLIWLTAKHLAFVLEMNNCKRKKKKTRREGKGKEKKKKEEEEEKKGGLEARGEIRPVDRVWSEPGYSIPH